jgi:hypothetical protein
MNKSPLEISLGRSLSGSIGGAAAVVLSILGLANVYPHFMAAIATIAVGATLLFKSLTIAAEYPKLLSQTGTGGGELGSGMSAELLAGGAGIVLGILALLGIGFQPLISIAVIVFGAGLLFGSTVVKSLNALKVQAMGAEGVAQRVVEDIVSAAMGTQVLVGIGSIVLGILSLIGFIPVVLNLVALLAIGAVSLLTGSAVTGKLMHAIRHTHTP